MVCPICGLSLKLARSEADKLKYKCSNKQCSNRGKIVAEKKKIDKEN